MIRGSPAAVCGMCSAKAFRERATNSRTATLFFFFLSFSSFLGRRGRTPGEGGEGGEKERGERDNALRLGYPRE
jgi:hypothetical protein